MPRLFVSEESGHLFSHYILRVRLKLHIVTGVFYLVLSSFSALLDAEGITGKERENSEYSPSSLGDSLSMIEYVVF